MNTMRTQAVAKRQTTAKRTLAIFEHIITGLKSKWEKAEKETTTKWLKSQRAEAVLGLTSFEPKSSCFFFTDVKLGKDQERNSGTSDQSKRILIASNRILKKMKQFFSIASFSPLTYVRDPEGEEAYQFLLSFPGLRGNWPHAAVSMQISSVFWPSCFTEIFFFRGNTWSDPAAPSQPYQLASCG